MLLRSAIIDALLSGDIYHSGCPIPDVNQHHNSNERKKQEEAFRLWCEQYVRQASIDLTLGRFFWGENTRGGKRIDEFTERFFVDTENNIPSQYIPFECKNGDPFALGPQRFALGHTEHVVGLGGNIVAKVSTRSTAGRFGLCVRRSAGLIDPGYRNHITLEIHNDTQRGHRLYPGRRYAQIEFFRGEGEPVIYDGRYTEKGDAWKPEDMLPQPLTN